LANGVLVTRYIHICSNVFHPISPLPTTATTRMLCEDAVAAALHFNGRRRRHLLDV